ncbi:alpha/beta fold hydrolase [Candidatus Latescibacterota bacterium]
MKKNNAMTYWCYSLFVAVTLLSVAFFVAKESKMEATDKNNIVKDIQKKYLDYKGHRIYYEVRGNSEKTLMFIHGWASRIDSWRYQFDSFRDYKVIAIDLPGHGQSSKNLTADYNMDLFSDTVKAIFDNEKVEKAFLFGHSMGFAISEVVCFKYPDLCAGIGSIDGAHFELPDDEKGRNDWVEYNRAFAKSLEEEKGREDFINALFLEDTPKILKKEVIAASRQLPLSIGKSIVSSMEDNMEYWKKRVVDIPCLAIHSPVYQLTEKYKADFLTMYPHAEYHEIKNVSHFLMLEMPYKINQLMLDYLEKVY